LTKESFQSRIGTSIIVSFEVAKASNNQLITTFKAPPATVNEAKDNLGRTTIYAPADGTVECRIRRACLGTQQNDRNRNFESGQLE
jgi:multidrug resistance efflux pump